MLTGRRWNQPSLPASHFLQFRPPLISAHTLSPRHMSARCIHALLSQLTRLHRCRQPHPAVRQVVVGLHLSTAVLYRQPGHRRCQPVRMPYLASCLSTDVMQVPVAAKSPTSMLGRHWSVHGLAAFVPSQLPHQQYRILSVLSHLKQLKVRSDYFCMEEKHA